MYCERSQKWPLRKGLNLYGSTSSVATNGRPVGQGSMIVRFQNLQPAPTWQYDQQDLPMLLSPYFPYGESPKNVSVVTSPVIRSRVLTIVTSWIRLMVMLVSFETALVREPIFSPLLLMMSILDSFCGIRVSKIA